MSLPDDDPVYTLKKVMEELDFSGLLANCSDKGRTGYNPIMIYAVVTYANMRGIRSVDRIVDLCERDLAFIWLTRGQKEFTEDDASLISEDETGMISYHLNHPSKDARLLLNAMILGLEQMVDDDNYAEYIDLTFEEV